MDATELNLKHIQGVVNEILASEIAYRDSLRVILNHYKPLVFSEKRLAETHLSTLFRLLEEIHVFSSELVAALECAYLDYRNFVECFILREKQILFLYSNYCVLLPSASRVLFKLSPKDRISVMLKKIQHDIKQNFPLSAELLKPFQRLFAYEVLLQKLTEVVPAEDGIVRMIYEHMKMILEKINELKRLRENRNRIKELLTLVKSFSELHLDRQGDLLYEGTVSDVKRSVTRHLILFERMLMISKKYFSVLICRNALMTKNLVIHDCDETNKVFSIEDVLNHSHFYFQASSLEQKKIWVKQLNKAITTMKKFGECGKKAMYSRSSSFRIAMELNPLDSMRVNRYTSTNNLNNYRSRGSTMTDIYELSRHAYLRSIENCEIVDRTNDHGMLKSHEFMPDSSVKYPNRPQTLGKTKSYLHSDFTYFDNRTLCRHNANSSPSNGHLSRAFSLKQNYCDIDEGSVFKFKPKSEICLKTVFDEDSHVSKKENAMVSCEMGKRGDIGNNNKYICNLLVKGALSCNIQNCLLNFK